MGSALLSPSTATPWWWGRGVTMTLPARPMYTLPSSTVIIRLWPCPGCTCCCWMTEVPCEIDVPNGTLFRFLIASRMSSSPKCVSAGSMVLSVVGIGPPHDGVRGVASQCIPPFMAKFAQHLRPLSQGMHVLKAMQTST